MFGNDRSHRRMMAAVLALAVPAFLITACNDDPLFDLPPDPPTNVVASVAGQDVTVNWVPGSNATSQEVRLTPVTPVPASAGNALQAQDYVQVYNDNTTNTHTFTDVEPGAYTATVTAINASSRAPSEVANVLVEGGSPAAPILNDFYADETEPTTLIVEWTGVEGAENYQVSLTANDESGDFSEIATATATSFAFPGTNVGTTYTAQVCLFTQANGVGECSNTLDFTVVGDVPVITSVALDEADATTLIVEWTGVEGAENYQVSLTADDESGDFLEIAPASPTSFPFSPVNPGTTYTVEVCLYTMAGGVGECGSAVDYTVNTAPTAEITAPADASVFFDTELITFTGTGTDAEDGALTGESLAWSSSVDGPLGTGEELLDVDASTVTPGAHVITLTATDSEGATGEASINITINEASSVISFPLLIQDHLGPNGANCTSCHVNGGVATDIPLDTWEGIVRGVGSDDVSPLIVIGDATMGVLIPVVTTGHNGAPAADAGIVESFETWVNDGAPNNN